MRSTTLASSAATRSKDAAGAAAPRTAASIHTHTHTQRDTDTDTKEKKRAGARVSRQREGRRAWRRGAVILQARPRGGFGGRGSARQGGEATCVLVEGAVVSGEREHRWQRNRAPARWCVVPKEFPQEMRRYRPPQVALRWAAGVLQALPRVSAVLLSLSAGVRATAPCAPLPLSSRLLTRALRRPFLPFCMLSLRVPQSCGTQ